MMPDTSNNRNFFDDLKDMLNANYPLIYLVTTEYNRTLQYVRNIAHNSKLNFNVWNCIDGLESHSKDRTDQLQIKAHPDKIKDYKDVLQHIKQSVPEQDKEIYFLEDYHTYFKENEVVVLLRKLAEQLKFYDTHVLIVGPFVKLPPELEKFITVVNIPLPDRADLEKRLNRILDKEQLHDDLKKLLIDSALGMTDMEADLAFRLAKQKKGLHMPEAARIVANEKEQIIKKSGLLDYFQVHQDLDKTVGGLENLKDWLKQRSKAFESKAQHFGLKEPKGILLLGVPGCGKSLTAKCIASLWKQPLLRLDVGKIFQAEVGASENNIRQAIQTAEAVAPCVLWIDEIEKGLSTGGGEKDGGTNSRVFSTILTWMQEKTKPVFVVATANNISDLPPELLRKGRFDEIFFVDLPTKGERKQIFEIHLNKYNQSNGIDLNVIANQAKFFNGAEIEETVKEAMFMAYLNDSINPQISIHNLESAVKEVVPLAITMKKKIDGLRNWASNRARAASDQKNNEEFEFSKKEQEEKDSVATNLTKRERQEDIF